MLIRLALLLLPLLVLGCASDSGAPHAEGAFVDDLGRTVVLPAAIDRVVPLAPSLTEVVYAAGAGARLVGVTTADDFPPATDTLPRFSALPLNYEAIAALRPDLVLATDQVNSPRDAALLAELGIPTVFLRFDALDDVRRSILTVGELLGTDAAAARTADTLWSRLDPAPLPPPTERPRVLVLVGDETLYSFGAGSYVHEMVRRAGGVSVTAALDEEAPVLSDEFVLQAQPDVIVGAFGPDYDPQRLLDLHPTWSLVPAVADGRVYGLDPDLVLRPGPRLVDGTRQMARWLSASP